MKPSREKVLAWLNGHNPTYLYRFRWNWAGWKFDLSQRHSDNAWGRFGGGWSFELGVQISRCTYIFNYGVGTLRIDNYRKLAKLYPERFTHRGWIYDA